MKSIFNKLAVFSSLLRVIKLAQEPVEAKDLDTIIKEFKDYSELIRLSSENEYGISNDIKNLEKIIWKASKNIAISLETMKDMIDSESDEERLQEIGFSVGKAYKELSDGIIGLSKIDNDLIEDIGGAPYSLEDIGKSLLTLTNPDQNVNEDANEDISKRNKRSSARKTVVRVLAYFNDNIKKDINARTYMYHLTSEEKQRKIKELYKKMQARDSAKEVGSLYQRLDSYIRHSSRNDNLSKSWRDTLTGYTSENLMGTFFDKDAKKTFFNAFDPTESIIKFLNSDSTTMSFDANTKNIDDLFELINPTSIEITSIKDSQIVKKFAIELSQFKGMFEKIKIEIMKSIEAKARELIAIKGGNQTLINLRRTQYITALNRIEQEIKFYRKSAEAMLTLLEFPLFKNSTNYKKIQQDLKENIGELPIMNKLDELHQYFADTIDPQIKDLIFMKSPVNILLLPEDLVHLLPSAISNCETMIKTLDTLFKGIFEKAKEPLKPGDLIQNEEVNACKYEANAYSIDDFRFCPYLMKILALKDLLIKSIQAMVNRGKGSIESLQNYSINTDTVAIDKHRDALLIKEYTDSINYGIIPETKKTSIDDLIKDSKKGKLLNSEGMFYRDDFKQMLKFDFYRKNIELFLERGAQIKDQILDKQFKKTIESDLAIIKNIINQFDTVQKPSIKDESVKIEDVDTKSKKSTTKKSTKKPIKTKDTNKEIEGFFEASINGKCVNDLYLALLENKLYASDGSFADPLFSELLGDKKYRAMFDKALLEIKMLTKDLDLGEKEIKEQAIEKIEEIVRKFDEKNSNIVLDSPITNTEPEIVKQIEVIPEQIVAPESPTMEKLPETIKPVEVKSPGKTNVVSIDPEIAQKESLKQDIFESGLSEIEKAKIIDQIDRMSLQKANELVEKYLGSKELDIDSEEQSKPALSKQNLIDRMKKLKLPASEQAKMLTRSTKEVNEILSLLEGGDLPIEGAGFSKSKKPKIW